MKILLTATVQSHICQFHKPLVRMLHKNGHEVHVAARDNLEEKNGLKLDFVEKVYNIPFSRSPKSKDNIKAYKELRKILQEEKYDIVHCNTPMGGIITRLATMKIRKNGTKVFYTAHGFHFYKGAPKINWLVYYPIEKLFSRITDKVITITEEDYQLARKKFHCEVKHIHGVGVDTSKCFIMSKEEKEQFREKIGLKDSEKMILNIGELLPNKNQKTAILAMKEIVKQVPECKLFIAGNGPEKENLENLIRENELESVVKLIGYTTDINKYLNVCELLMACSFREGLPLNLMEAMLCGKAIVASDNRGHRELIKEGINGFLVETRDEKAFVESVLKILLGEKDYSQIALMTVKPFTDANVCEELKEIYQVTIV